MKYEYNVVRTYDDGKYEESLQNLFRQGYEFVRASEYVPMERHNGTTRYGYIEYIVRREVE